MENENNLPPGTHQQTNMIDSDEANHAIEGVAYPIIDLLNKYSEEHGPTNTLFACLYATGAALANYGAVLDEGVDLRQQLSPLFTGYQTQIEADRKEKIH